MNKIKVTPLFLVLVPLEIILIFCTLYYLLIDNKGGMALAGLISLIAAIFNGTLIVIERLVINVKGMNNKWIWTIELIIIACAIIFIIQNGISFG
ncbi:hypothetical protein OX283_003190 [Flavobacterium sp. SUN052]|uniref:hypothetical protein n=1 Tax=Flavobacterium sp. SUN052 TaxID=3002441 RepID=UPI00237E916D|nr:hypothetical protein [Flavobacterium sp. SUN052]MEC4003652.1 hypothetical protein [Flavobacterium sp. SUN052]